jgi:transcriptional antiterminator RfaH
MKNTNRDGWNWYVIHTHPKQEERTSSNLNVGGIETLTPKLWSKKANQFTGKMVQTIKPLFPGYIFARFAFEEQYHNVRYTRGVHSLVSFSNAPTPIDDEIIDLIRSRIGPDGFVNLLEDLKPGDQVVINEGRFQHLSGVFERQLEDADRVRILLDTVTFQAHVVVDRALVNRVASGRRSAA